MTSTPNNSPEQRPTKTKFDSYLSSEPLIIKDPEAFKVDSTPPLIIERRENEELYRELSVFLNYKKPNNLLILGFPGSGKTVSVRFALRIIQERKPEFKTIFVNCYGKSSLEILRDMQGGQAVGKVQQALLKFLESLDKDCILVLDEIDRSDRIIELLYGLSRPAEICPSFKKNINLILVSNNSSWEDNIQDRIRSSLQLKKLVFEPYRQKEIKSILDQRIKRGFITKEAISEKTVEDIAKYVVEKRRSDCRLAIEILFFAGLGAERAKRNKIEDDDINRAIQNATHSIDKLMVGKLDDSQLITLFAISSSGEEGIETIDQVHKNYTDIITKNKLSVKLKSRVMIHFILNCLDNLGLIQKNIEIKRTADNKPYRIVRVVCKIPSEIVIGELNIRGLRLSEGYENR